MKMRIFSILLCAVMVLALLPTVALADNAVTATPTANVTEATKPNIIKTSLDYTLTNEPAYASGTTFRVYANADRTSTPQVSPPAFPAVH